MRKRKLIQVLSASFLILAISFSVFNYLALDEMHMSLMVNSELEENRMISQGDGQTQPDSAVKPAKTVYRVVINLDERKLHLYKNEELMKSYPVSGGKSSTPSPVGTWRIVGKAKWGEGFGGSWMALNVPWGKYGIHGTVYPWAIGSNVSKGCIRMLNKDARELYKLLPYGTAVTIIQDNPPFRTIRNGHFGSDVLTVQQHLRELGYYKANPDGRYGNYLMQVVKAFQKANKLPQTGKVDRATYNKILASAQARPENTNTTPPGGSNPGSSSHGSNSPSNGNQPGNRPSGDTGQSGTSSSGTATPPAGSKPSGNNTP